VRWSAGLAGVIRSRPLTLLTSTMRLLEYRGPEGFPTGVRMRPSWVPEARGVLLAACLTGLGCTGVVRENGPRDNDDGPSSGPGQSGVIDESLNCAEPPVPRAPLRRLTRFEYNNTVRDLLDVQTRPADALPGEELGNGFGNDADALGVSPLLIDGYRTVAADIAKALTASPAKAVAVAGCDPVQTGEAPCVEQFLASFLGKAFRRPATSEDLAAYTLAFERGQEIGGDFPSGVRLVIERALQAPEFLYRVELGETLDGERGLGRPSAYEMASRLSYLLWGSMPDSELLSAAERGKLATPEGVLLEAERLLTDPSERYKDVVRYFHGHLFGIAGLDRLERNADFYPTYRAGMGALFRRETELFLDEVIWNGSGDLSGIFTAPYTFVNDTLAAFYGYAGVTADGFQKIALDPTRRAGVLTQASILSATTPGSRTDPVVRGKWVYTKLLCGLVADPPSNVPQLPAPEPGLGVRERLAMHQANESCRGCHSYMDPIGFGFEHYDGAGLWREADDGVPIDDSGEIVGSDIEGPFEGVIELGQKIAQSNDAKACYVGNFLAYAYGRKEDDRDGCTRASLEGAFEQSNGNVKALLLAITQADAFLYRPVVVPGN
jgi:hypothetical protein